MRDRRLYAATDDPMSAWRPRSSRRYVTDSPHVLIATGMRDRSPGAQPGSVPRTRATGYSTGLSCQVPGRVFRLGDSLAVGHD